MTSYVSHASAIASSSEEDEDHIVPDSIGVVRTTEDTCLLDPQMWPHHQVISETCQVRTLERDYDPDSLDRLCGAAEELVERGACVIVTDAGFSSMQREVARRIRVPVVASAMVQLPSLFSTVQGSVGVVTIDRQQISQWHLVSVGADPETPIIGMPLDSPWRRADAAASICNPITRADREREARMFDELATACDELVARYRCGAIVLEEPRFATMTHRLHRRLPVRIFDVVSCAGWLHAGHRTLAKQSELMSGTNSTTTRSVVGGSSIPASPRSTRQSGAGASGLFPMTSLSTESSSLGAGAATGVGGGLGDRRFRSELGISPNLATANALAGAVGSSSGMSASYTSPPGGGPLQLSSSFRRAQPSAAASLHSYHHQQQQQQQQQHGSAGGGGGGSGSLPHHGNLRSALAQGYEASSTERSTFGSSGSGGYRPSSQSSVGGMRMSLHDIDERRPGIGIGIGGGGGGSGGGGDGRRSRGSRVEDASILTDDLASLMLGGRPPHSAGAGAAGGAGGGDATAAGSGRSRQLAEVIAGIDPDV